VFVYDKKNKIVNQLVSDGARLQPELMYFGDSDTPAIGLPRLSNDSRLEQRIICGEKIYVFDESENRFDIVSSKRLFHGKKKGEYPSDLSCED
jgi:hypothetical protein